MQQNRFPNQQNAQVLLQFKSKMNQLVPKISIDRQLHPTIAKFEGGQRLIDIARNSFSSDSESIEAENVDEENKIGQIHNLPSITNSVPKKMNGSHTITNENNCINENKESQQIKSQQAQNNEFEMNQAKFDLKKLQIINQLGAGAQGVVELAFDRNSKRYIALKQIPLNPDETNNKLLLAELQTLQQCDSPYIVKCYGADYHQGIISVALELMDMGSLYDILQQRKYLSAEKKGIPQSILGLIIYQILQGLVYLHKVKHVIHRDIKPSNLLVNSKGEVKISDFGVSGKMVNTNDNKRSQVGTMNYMSPERLRGDIYKMDTDIWSLGLSIIELATGKHPFLQNTDKEDAFLFWELMDYIQSKPPPKLPDNFSEDFKEFVSLCLQKNSDNRLSSTQLLKHKFMLQYEGVPLIAFQKWLQAFKQQVQPINLNK